MIVAEFMNYAREEIEPWIRDHMVGWTREALLDFYNGSLAGKNLSGRNLEGIDLSYIDMRDAILRRTNLSNASLQSACLHETDLSGANLYCADLNDTNLRKANFIMANMRSAKLHNAELSGSVFINAAGVTEEQLISAKNMYKAMLPQHLNYLKVVPVDNCDLSDHCNEDIPKKLQSTKLRQMIEGRLRFDSMCN